MAFNLTTIWYTVQDLYQPFKDLRRELKLYQFNSYLQMADKELFYEMLKDKKNNQDVLNKFRKSVTVDSSTSQAFPAGYCEFIAARDGTVEVEYVDLDEYVDRKTNSLTAPSATYPIVYTSNGTFITDPTDIGTYTLYYYGENVGANAPLLALKKDASSFGNVNIYDSVNSVALVWPEYMYYRIVIIMLKYLGMSINDPAVVQEKLKEIADATV